MSPHCMNCDVDGEWKGEFCVCPSCGKLVGARHSDGFDKWREMHGEETSE